MKTVAVLFLLALTACTDRVPEETALLCSLDGKAYSGNRMFDINGGHYTTIPAPQFDKVCAKFSSKE